MKLLIVGELNPYGANPAMALYHLPRHASGNRLREIMGLRDTTYHALSKVNLCTGKWYRQSASGRICQLTREITPDVVLLLGRKVQQAFEGPNFFESLADRRLERFGPDDKLYVWPSFTMVTLPHPSGLNPMWNEPGARARARELLRANAPWIPWGETEGTT